MNFAELRRELRAFVEKSIVNRLSPSEFRLEAQKIANKYLAPKEYEKATLDAITKEYDYSNANALLKDEQAVISELLSTLNPDFAKQKVGLRKDIIDVVNLGLKQGEFSKQLQGRVEGIIGKYRNYANTIIISGLSSFDQLITTKDDNLDTLYEYIGPSPQRQFCKNYLGRQMTRRQINALSERLGYDVFLMHGGFRCRHSFIKVVK